MDIALLDQLVSPSPDGVHTPTEEFGQGAGQGFKAAGMPGELTKSKQEAQRPGLQLEERSGIQGEDNPLPQSWSSLSSHVS